MFKILVFLTRRPGMTLSAMREHYETVHLALARRTFPQIIEHRRNWPDEKGIFFPENLDPPPFDCITEIWFEDRSGFDDMPKLLADPVASEEIKQDELRFLGNL